MTAAPDCPFCGALTFERRDQVPRTRGAYDIPADCPVELTVAQAIALARVYLRPLGAGHDEKNEQAFNVFLQTVTMGPGCVMVPWAGMYLGIEPDGYVHS